MSNLELAKYFLWGLYAQGDYVTTRDRCYWVWRDIMNLLEQSDWVELLVLDSYLVDLSNE